MGSYYFTPVSDQLPHAVAVFCGANLGTESTFQHAATSLGHALAKQASPLVYGGGSRGMMGIISRTVLQNGGSVTAVIPSAMVRAGGEGDCPNPERYLAEKGREKATSHIVVDTIHERKVAMARRVRGFIGLPGGYGTFAEIMEVTTWTQLGIHTKPVVLVNVLGFFDPLRRLIKGAVDTGFVKGRDESLMVFVDCPPDEDPDTFDWGTAALSALDGWCAPGPGLFAWTPSLVEGDSLAMSQ
ncbi:hypothetical protein F5148DRAFT_978676 [Russula earlei]|uniref:Uncharacterized protein n=1 Tax=Russula earlei TaxID=71964 RepID=A0ACC0UDP5_9AGAM|nr:hypothetical protein F5148DRAFT_978676 [Russula earlei]